MIINVLRYILIFTILLGVGGFTQAQPSRISGQVIDDETEEPIPFANIYIKGTSAAAIADDSGYYNLTTRLKRDSITATFLGFQSISKPYKIKETQVINFRLKKSTTTFEAVVVKPGENPAHRILRKIWNYKKLGQLKDYNVQCNVYNKLQIKLSNIDEDFKNKKIFKPFQFVFENMDTNALNGKTYLPILISETSTDYYHQNNPGVEKEVVKASKISGINNESIREFVSGINQSFNPFEDYMVFYNESGFVSPFSESGLLFYRYYLTDSIVVEGKKIYTVTFKPRRKQERTFFGTFKVEGAKCTLKSLEMTVNPEANLNYISEFKANYSFEPVNDSVSLLKKEHLIIDFNLADYKKLKGLQGEKTTIYSNFRFNEPIPVQISQMQEKISFNDSTQNSFSESDRPEQLTRKEEKVYEMVDSIKNVPAFRTTYDLLKTIFDAHYDFGKFKVGPYFSTYSYNKVEGHRFRIGGTTTRNFSEKIKLTAYTAYGTYDKDFKFYANSIFILNKSPRIALNATLSHDVSQLNIPPGALINDNIVSSFLRRFPFEKLQMIDYAIAQMESDLTPGITMKVSINHKNVHEGPYIPFIDSKTGVPVSSIKTTELGVGFHFENGQKFFSSTFKRFRIRNYNPAFDLNVMAAPKRMFHNKYSYVKFKFKVSHFLTTNPFGYNAYNIEFCKTRGKAPWPLLEVMSGNETYGLYRFAYNMMNYYEFVADSYVAVSTEQHLQGMIFNYIPLLRKLKFREVISCKAVAGRIDRRNEDELKMPEYMHRLNKPYIEVGVGIENILKIVRVDAMWRLTHKNNSDAEIFGIRARFQFML